MVRHIKSSFSFIQSEKLQPVANETNKLGILTSMLYVNAFLMLKKLYLLDFSNCFCFKNYTTLQPFKSPAVFKLIISLNVIFTQKWLEKWNKHNFFNI